MKSFLMFIALLCAVTLSSSSAPTVTNAANIARKDRAEINFYQPVQLMGVTLQGQYTFVHDDVAMARGEACTYVYKGFNESPKNLVATFHCTPILRNKVGYFTVRTALNSMGELEIKEFQFAGSTESHLVPSSLHTAHVGIVPIN